MSYEPTSLKPPAIPVFEPLTGLFVIEPLVNLVCSGASDRSALSQIVEMAQLKTAQQAEFLKQLSKRSDELDSAQIAGETAIMQISKQGNPISEESLATICDLYQKISPNNNIRNSLLHLLGSEGSEPSLRAWADLITTHPPSNPHGLIQSFAPLIQHKNLPNWLFTSLATQGIAHPEIASASLDLMNYHVRQGNLAQHPAIDRAQQLTSLLGSVVQQMARVEEGNVPDNLSPQELSQKVSDSVALTISLTDALALMNYDPAIGKFRQAMQLKHRRLQTEAAAALARMNVEEGRECLAQLAEEPIARLRVLAFAEELGILDKIPEACQSEIAVAESKLATWLAEPNQMGIAPSEIELVDNREMYWPSYEHPVQCYLFRFRYGTDPVYSNLAISGPLVHVFPNNIEGLTVDDAFAAFAGWQAVHPEIFQISLDQAEELYAEPLQQLKDRLTENGLSETQPELVGSFFGEIVLIAKAIRNSEPVMSLVDENEVFCFRSQSEEDRIDANMAYTIWRGRRLLAQFNR